MDFGLKGKAALVTGAARGIGKAEALALAAEGCSIAINDIDREAAEATVAELRANGTEAVACIGDVSEEAGAEAVVREAHRGLGQLDILVNNAGAGGRHLGSLAENMSLDDWDIIVRTHLRSTFLCSKYAVPLIP